MPSEAVHRDRLSRFRAAYAALGSHPRLIWVAAIVAPALVGLALVPARAHLTTADDTLVFVLVIVVIAASGSRRATGVAALVSALAVDFFLIQPYQSFQINRQADAVTVALFLLVGLAAGELAARGHRYRRAAIEGSRGLARLHDVGEQIVGGENPEFVLMSVANQLRELLSLQDCQYARRPPSGKGAWIETDGTVRLNPLQWPASSVGLPTRQVELPVRGGGRVLGTFILTPTPARPISHDRCVVAVAMADQLGAVLAAEAGRDAGAG
jgi:K+-sensing histidine kinase KdpD